MKQLVIALKERFNYKQIDQINFKSNIFMQIRYLLSTPFIYGMAIPMIFFHILIEIYHRVTFYLYDIKYVDYKKHFIFSRHKIYNISPIQKLNCIYCEYGNGLASYVKEIIGKTETYWCPIKNNKDMNITHNEYKYFMDIKDTDRFEIFRDKVRERVLDK
jgi:hypothetical protein